MRTAFAKPAGLEPALCGWTDNRIAFLRRVAAGGGSYADAAELLGVSRNAVAGKAYRLRLRFDCDHEVRAQRSRLTANRRWHGEGAAA